MVSLWGSKNGDGQHNDLDNANDDENSQQQPRQSRDADERTRLLPPRGEGYLDPDDPAVSLHCALGIVVTVLISTAHR